jgi:predicted nucleic-acid-binding Zn-ribbon protein
MRATQTCPKCAGKRFVVTDEFRHPEPNDGVCRLPALTLYEPERDDNPEGRWVRKTAGSFESWICLGCGYTELYAKGLDGIEALARKHPERSRIVDTEHSEQGPYR